jgi:hypothetical protein
LLATPSAVEGSAATVLVVKTPDVIAGVVRVGLVPNTSAPDPVSSVTTAARFALDGVAKNVATLAPNPLTPVEMGSPVQFVNTPLAGVPSAGVTNVGLVSVLFVRVSVPASVASVPLVGSVTFVVPVNVSVTAPPVVVKA